MEDKKSEQQPKEANPDSDEIVCDPGACPKCGSIDLEYDDEGCECDSSLGVNNSLITYTYFPFKCNKCNCKATEVFVDEYSYTTIDDEEDSDN